VDQAAERSEFVQAVISRGGRPLKVPVLISSSPRASRRGHLPSGCSTSAGGAFQADPLRLEVQEKVVTAKATDRFAHPDARLLAPSPAACMNMRSKGAGFREHRPHDNLLRWANASRVPGRRVRPGSNMAGDRPGPRATRAGRREFFAGSVICSHALASVHTESSTTAARSKAAPADGVRHVRCSSFRHASSRGRRWPCRRAQARRRTDERQEPDDVGGADVHARDESC